MAVDPVFREFALEQLGAVTPAVRSRSMFGGVGVYSGSLFFALLSGDELYLKVDDTNRADFEQIGMGPFQPFGPDGGSMQYYQLPGDILEDPGALAPWTAKAVEVARRAKGRKKR